MKIFIDEKEMTVVNKNQNIVEIAEDNGITMIAPCFRNKKKNGCCKACLIEVNGEEKYACGTLPEDQMRITYNRDDLNAKRKERLKQYVQPLLNPVQSLFKINNSC